MYAKYCSVSCRIASRSVSSKPRKRSLSRATPPSLRSCNHWPAKFSTNCVGPGVIQHPDHLPAEIGPQRSRACLAEQLVVGHAAPEKIREPAGQLELGQRAIFARLFGLDQEQELRGGEHRRQGELDGAFVTLTPVVGQPKDLAGLVPLRRAARAVERPVRRTGRSPGGHNRAAIDRRIRVCKTGFADATREAARSRRGTGPRTTIESTCNPRSPP